MSKTPSYWEETIQPGASWSHVLKRGTALRITDVEGGANVGAIFYNFECPVERYNMPDTLKAQHIARLTTGFVLYSDMGRILLSVIADTVGWHDPIGGTSNRQLVEQKYGSATYQEFRNEYHKNGRESFLIELGKWGLGPRDLVPNVNFFSRVEVAEDGSMTFVPDNSKAGDFLELRAEMNVLAILNTCQHPLDPSSTYRPKPVKVAIRQVAAPPALDDPCRISRPENGRGFTLTERYFL
jgi:urea carboxylase-associated protein 2